MASFRGPKPISPKPIIPGPVSPEPIPEPIGASAIVATPPPGMGVPAQCRFSRDGRYLAFLWGGERVAARKGLYVVDLADRSTRQLVPPSAGIDEDTPLTLDEELARERERDREIGITDYAWAPDGRALLIRVRHRLWSVAVTSGATLWTYEHAEPLFFPAFSPDGSRLAFVSGGNLWCLEVPAAAGPTAEPVRARPLTSDGSDERLNGIADQMAWEEFGRGKAFWWGKDAKTICYTATDIGHIPAVAAVSDRPGRPERHRYVFPGAALPRWRLLCLDIESGAVRTLDTGAPAAAYLIDVTLCPDGRRLWVRILDRPQERLDVLAVPLDAGPAEVLFREEARPWLNVHAGPSFVDDGGTALWPSEATGLVRLTLRGPDGGPRCRLPAPAGTLRDIVGLDRERGFVYFLASDQDPREQHLYRCGLAADAALERLTTEPGWHQVVMDAKARVYAHVFSSLETPPIFRILSLNGGEPLPIACDDDRPERLGLRPPLMKTVVADDGETPLHCALYCPTEPDPAGNPVLVAVYGGPHQQVVTNSWSATCDLRAQRFAQQGYFVLKVDNRGSWGRGKPFEVPLHRNFGDTELRDQVRALQRVAEEHGGMDLDRVGVYGWSYGGYMAVLCLLRAPERFKVAVAGAPVVRWDFYDAAYTERYMGIPEMSQTGPEDLAYRTSSLLGDVPALAGDLLLVHGTRDENVLFNHTLAFLAAAAAAGKRVDLLLFADERHGIRKTRNREHLEERLFEYLDTRLGRPPQADAG